MDYSFKIAQVEVTKNFTKIEQIKLTAKLIAEEIRKKKEKEEKKNA